MICVIPHPSGGSFFLIGRHRITATKKGTDTKNVLPPAIPILGGRRLGGTAVPVVLQAEGPLRESVWCQASGPSPCYPGVARRPLVQAAESGLKGEKGSNLPMLSALSVVDGDRGSFSRFRRTSVQAAGSHGRKMQQPSDPIHFVWLTVIGARSPDSAGSSTQAAEFGLVRGKCSNLPILSVLGG
jgi:hypothetical protein